jgi:hypothetical protein
LFEAGYSAFSGVLAIRQPHNQGYEKQDQKYCEQNAGDTHGSAGNTCESKHTGNQRNH